MTNRHLVFVYGTLKHGCHNAGRLESATPMGNARTVDRYLLLDGGAFPFLINPEHIGQAVDLSDCIGHVKGELYMVDDATLARLDLLESHPRFYKRERVPVIEQGCNDPVHPWVYFLNMRGRTFDPTHGLLNDACKPDSEGNCEWWPVAYDDVPLNARRR